MRPATTASGAFTLLEVILTLALSSLLLGILTMAIHTQLRVVDKGRLHVEEAQLARALLHRIAADIRGTVRYDPVDLTKLVPEMSDEAIENLTEESESGDSEDGTGSAGTAGEADQLDIEDGDAEEESTVLLPGLYGNRYELQVDVSRLPRIDQFQQALVPAGSRLVDRLSDVKTVAYYVVGPESGALGDAAGPAAGRGGLVRLELDRAVTYWAAEQGNLQEMQVDLEPIAPEVLAIEFLYFDGQQWLEEWDSNAQGGLPVAVQIGIAIEPVNQRGLPVNRDLVAQTDSDDADSRPIVYRLLVHLPASAPRTDWGTDSEEDSEEDSEGTEDEESDEMATDEESSEDPAPADMTPFGSPEDQPPGEFPVDPGSFSPDMLPPGAMDAVRSGSIDPSAFRGQSFNPEMLRGRSFNPDMFNGGFDGGSIDPGMIRDRLREAGIPLRGGLGGRSFGGGGSGGGRGGGGSGSGFGGGGGGR